MWFSIPVRFGLVVALAAVLASAPTKADEADDQYAVAAGHYARGQWKLAAEQFQSYLDNYPNHPMFQQGVFFLAEALLQMGRFDEASQRFGQYLEHEPDGKFARSALFRWGEAAYLADKPQAAKIKLEQFLGRYLEDNLNAYVLAYLGDIALSQDDPHLAEEYFSHALAQFPHAARQDNYRFGLAQALEKQGSREAAERLYLAVAAKTSSPLADDAQFHLAALQYASGRFEEAIAAFDAFESSSSESPWQPTARLGRGWALLKLGRLAEAQSCFNSISSDPQLGIQARYWLGLTQKAQQDWHAAAQTLLEAAAADPKHELVPAMQFHAGDALLRAGDTAAARGQFDKVIAYGPDDNEWIDDAMRGKVQAALRAKDYETLDRQAEEFSARFAHSPLYPDVRRMLARSLIERRQYARAGEMLKPLVSAEDGRQQNPEDGYLLSLAYQGLERYDDALAALSPVLKSASATGTGQLLADARLAQASLLVTTKRFEEAVAPLETFLAGQPTGEAAVEARAQLAICYARTDQLDKAKQLYGELLEKQPRHELVLPATEQLAEVAYQAGDLVWSGRLFAWLSTESRSPEYQHKGLSGLGWSQFKAGQWEEAAATFSQLLQNNPDAQLAAEAAMVRGYIFQQLGRPDPALAMYDLVIDRYPESQKLPEALWAAARLHDQLDQDQQAAALYKRLVNEYPQFPQLHAALYGWAWVLEELGRSDESTRLFERIGQQYPQSPYWADATFRVAQRAFEARDYARSRELATAVLTDKPDSAIRENVLYLLGQIAAAEGKWHQAAQAFETLIADYPESSLRLMADYGIAESLFRQGDYQAAGKRLERLVSQTQGHEESWLAIVHLRLAQALGHQKKWDDAYAIASEIEARFPEFEEQYEVDYVLGRSLASRADFQRALDAYRKVIRSPAGAKTETAAKAQLMIAESYFHQENYQAALRDYLRLEILYDYPQLQAAALLQAAKCRELLGEWKEAVQLYTRLLKTYPETDCAAEAAQRQRDAERRCQRPDNT